MSLQTFSNQEEQIDACIKSIQLSIKNVLEKKPSVVIAVSGGKSPIPLFNKLSNLDLDFSKITFTLVDDRIVDSNHVDSNEHLVYTHLLQNNAKSAKFTGLVNNKVSLDEMINNANKNIKTIDLAILGMGDDGHTASIFPDCKEVHDALDLNNASNYIITNPISAKYARISLTLAALIKIPNLILSINGENKLKVLKEAILQDNLNYPVSFVLSRAPKTQIFWYK